MSEKTSDTRKQRSEKIEELRKLFAQAKAGVLTDYRGLTVAKMTNLRRKFREKGVSYLVAKNTLVKLAVRGTPIENLKAMLEGPTGIALSQLDPIAAAKVAQDFAKDNEALKIKGGFLGNAVLSTSQVADVSRLPSVEGIRAQFLSVLNTSIQQLLGVINGVPREFVGVLKAQADKGVASA